MLNRKIGKIIIWTGSAIYLLFLFYVTLFGRLSEQITAVSLCPLWSYAEIIRTGIPGLATQIVLNILIFIPVGIILPLFGAEETAFRRTVLCGFLLSVMIEAAQFLFHLGWCDIDDVIHNTLGAVLGYKVWREIDNRWLLKDEGEKVKLYRRPRRYYTKHILRNAALITIGCYLFFFIFLFFADGFYDILDNIIISFTARDNHFSGETWFSVVASSVAAIPGVLCGVFALLQTQRLHELETRYHRPSLGLQYAEMKVNWIHDRQFGQTIDDYRWFKFAKKAAEKDTANLLSFSFDIEVKNDTEVKQIIPEQIEFIFSSESFIMRFTEDKDEWKEYRSCELKYDKGRYLFHIRWEIFPYTIIRSNDMNDTGEEDTEIRFWEGIEKFTNYEDRLEEEYKSLSTRVTAKVYYEYASAKYETVVGVVSWKKDDGEGRHGATAVRCTNSGIFTYRDTE